MIEDKARKDGLEGTDTKGDIEENKNDPRAKLVGGVQTIHKGNAKLDDAERLGLATHALFVDSNRELSAQREGLLKTSDRNVQIKEDLKKGDKIIKSMHLREFKIRILMFALIGLFILLDIIYPIWKIFG